MMKQLSVTVRRHLYPMMECLLSDFFYIKMILIPLILKALFFLANGYMQLVPVSVFEVESLIDVIIHIR